MIKQESVDHENFVTLKLFRTAGLCEENQTQHQKIALIMCQ